VKNVAGYDLCKLFTGSLGTLGVIVSVNFKVFPRPKQTILVHGRFEKAQQAFAAARELNAASQYYSFIIVELDVTGADPTVYALIEGFSGALEKQTNTAQSAISRNEGVASVTRGQDAHGQIAKRIAIRSPAGDSVIRLRGAVAPGRVDGVWHAIASTLCRSHGESTYQADIVTGTFSARIAPAGGDPSALAASIGQLRTSVQELGGHFKIAGGTPGLRLLVEAWGAPQSAEVLSRTIKARLDPHVILNPGRFAYGI
jgi:glycolate oxidase FAD binding subunit